MQSLAALHELGDLRGTNDTGKPEEIKKSNKHIRPIYKHTDYKLYFVYYEIKMVISSMSTKQVLVGTFPLYMLVFWSELWQPPEEGVEPWICSWEQPHALALLQSEHIQPGW